MTQMMKMNKMRYRRAAFLLSLLLLLSIGLAAHAQTEVPLKNYAASIQAELKANADGDALPPYVENGQKLFFGLQISNFNSQELVTYLKANPEADFTIPLDFTGHIKGKYPTKINPDDFDNVAYVNGEELNGEELFRWWIDESSDLIRIRFDEEWIEKAGSNTVVENVTLGFDGTLGVADKSADGKIVFNAAGYSFPLQMKTGYTLNKTAGVPYYSTDASSYVTDYTVTLTLDQNMMLSGSGDMYIAALTLVDTVENGGALQGTIVGDVTVTAPDGETASAAVSNNGVVNTLTLSSPDQKLVKGTYTFTYKMKIDQQAAAAKLDGYTEKQKTNTVELKENAASLKTPLKAQATIAWEDVTDNQFKIDKSAFTDKAPDYKGVYWDKEKYYIDFRVVVYVREPVSTFTVTDHSNYSLTFRNVPASPMLAGVDTSANYWNNDINTATLTNASATVTSELNSASEMVITVTAPEGQKLAPGAYHLRVPADVTGAVETTLKNSYPQSYSNTAYLTSVDGRPTTENKEFKQAIPNRTEPRKDGGYAVDSTTGELVYYNGKPVIRWDVWLGWDFYNKTSFEDTLSGMEMLINANYPFEIHSFTDQNHRKECLASITSLNDTEYLDFNANGTGFTFTNEELYTNADGTPVKLYKLVYFTTPLDADNEQGYVNTDLENGYSITHTTLNGQEFGTGPITGDVEPDMTSQGRLYVKKKHVIERTDSLTQWLITCDNTTNKIPFARFDDLDIIDLVPRDQTPIGEVTVHYSDKWPIEVEMVCSNNQRVTLTEGTHYSIAKSHDGYNFGENGEYGFAVDLDMDAVAAVLAAQNSAYFKTIEVKCYLNNETHPSGKNYTIKNDGWLNYTNQGVELEDGVNASYDRGFATKSKGVVEYGDNYDPNAPRKYYVCNPDGTSSQQSFTGGYDDDPTTGDGQDEIVWRIYLGAREFGNDDEPIQVTVTDIFSNNQMFPTYEGKSVKDLFIIRAEKNQDYVILPDSVSVNGNSFTLTFTVPAKGWVEGDKDKSKNLYIYYHTILKPEAMQEALDAAAKDASTIKIDYTNKANVGWNGESYTLPTSSGSMTMNGSMLDKTAKFMLSAGNKVSYTIEMNPYKLDLASGSDVILLEDSMGNGKDVFAYIPSSFKVTNLDTGAQMSPSTAASSTTYVLKMAEDGKSFTLDVPDNTHLKLTYQVKTTQPVGTKDVTLLNNASLAGRKPQQKSITFDVSSAYQSGSFSVRPDEAGIRLVKISSEGADSDAPTFLSGAEFTLTQLDAAFQQVGTVQTMTTDAKGLIEIKQKITDVVYLVIEETKAPEGYRLGSEPWKWCYALVQAGDSLSDEDMAKLKEKVNCDVTVIPAGSYVEDSITNEPVTLTVRKVDQAGNLLEGAQFTLRMGDTEIEPDKTHTVAGELRFKNLKAGDYTLAETQAPTGYAVPAECPWNFTLDANGSVAFDKAYGYLALSNDGLYLRVINTPETSAITVKKVWNDNADQDGKRNGVVANVILSKTVEGVTTDIESVKVDPEDDWSYEWFNLPVYEDNKPITYSIREELVEANGYTSDTTEAKEVIKNGVVTITNTYVPELTKVSIVKIWDDEENQDGKRPDALTVTLSDGTEVELNEGNSWTATIENLPMYKDGEKIVYSWAEGNMPEGYTLTKTEVNGTVTTLTNSYTPEVTSATVKKNWDDKEDQDGKRPDTLTVTLSDGTEVELNEGNSWTATVENLPMYEDGEKIVYTWAEGNMPEGYKLSKTEVNGTVTTLTNSYTPEVTSATVKKNWDDKEDQDGKRPDTLTVTLSDGTEVELNEGNSWTATVENLPMYEDGEEIVYAWTEGDMPEGYTLTKTEVNGTVTTLTNSYTPELTSATVKKTWDDKDNQDGKRPETLTVTLSDGTEVELNEGNSWTATVENLPKYADGEEIVYSWSEGDMPEGYTLTKTDVNGTVTTLTNSYEPEKTEVSVGKVWDDKDNRENKRPDSVSVQLYAGGSVLGEPVTLNEANQWTHTWSGLDKYADGAEIDYTVDENSVPDGYVKSVNGNAKDGFTVKNTYVFGVTAQIKASKTLMGRDLEANQFTFILKDASGSTVQEVGHDKDGNVLFDALVYEQADEYTYTVEEKNDGKAGYIYDNKVYEVTVKVTQNEDDHQLKAEVTHALAGEEVDAITFENAYKAQGSVQFRGVKTLMDGEMEEGQFSFQLQDAEGKEIETVRNDANALFTFSEITYDETMLGDHTYTLIEVDEGRPGYVYDDIEYEITVTVSDAGDGTLDVSYTVNGEENGALHFENEYVAEEKVQFVGKKTLTGRDLAEGQFSFTLTGEEVNETVTNDKDGKFSFTEITYDETMLGDHTYTVTEVNDGKAGYTYDATEYEIIVTVTDAGDGTLTVTYTVNGEENGNITFENEYAAEGSVQFEGVKTLTGRDLEEGQFSFSLIGETFGQTVKNDKDGNFVFTEITYDETMLGDHTYTVTEVNDGKAGYTYSEAEYEIVVTVEDNGDGTLDVTYTVNGETDTEIAFENEYAAEGSVQFSGTKTLTGRDLEEGQFSFTLTGEEVNETVTNEKDGKFAFTEITYDETMLGDHSYTVTEVNDGKAGYTYDDAEYEIIVNVEDNGDGTLDVTYTVNGEEDAEILFKNGYTADATVTISGEKTVGGEKPEADEIFSFQLKDADGKVLQEVENDGSSITFAEIPFTLADAGKTYTYTIQESTESNEQYLTDGSVYTVQVALTDKGDGTLSIEWTLEKNGEEAEKIAFDNTPLSHLDIEKTVIGRAGDQEKLFAFKVTLTDEDGKALKGTFPVEGANVTSIESGSYLHLKHGEKATVKCLPVGTKYVVEEDEYTAFETEAQNAEGEITEEGSKAEFVNTLKTVSFSVTKEWQGGDNGLITLTLYENGKKMEPQPTYTESNNVYSYEKLPQYTEEGKAIVYAAKEKYMDGYMTIYRNIAPYAQETDMIYNGGTIVNKAVTSFHVQKVWEGLAEDEETPEITLTLYCNGEKLDKKTPTPNEDGWYIWHNLPLTYKGEAAEYTVVEEPLEGFTVSYGEAAEGEEEPTCARDYGTIVNRKIPRTGDESNIGLWIALTALSGCLFVLLMKKRKEA